jgi:hypothetical protein
VAPLHDVKRRENYAIERPAGRNDFGTEGELKNLWKLHLLGSQTNGTIRKLIYGFVCKISSLAMVLYVLGRISSGRRQMILKICDPSHQTGY